MKNIPIFLLFILTYSSCSLQPKVNIEAMPNTYLIKTDVHNFEDWRSDNYNNAMNLFLESCKTKQTQNIYRTICEKAKVTTNIKQFFEDEFILYKIYTPEGEDIGLLTGYYEASLRASRTKHDEYIYPIYKKPKDLISVNLSSIYPELREYRLRGRIEGDKLIPYYTRGESQDKSLDADVLCYCNSKIDKFFLEVQGSGRVFLDDNTTIFVGFENQNGHKYRSIGKYLVEIGALSAEEVSLQSIREWFNKNPLKINEVLNYNQSMVFFEERKKGATGSLGLELTPMSSIAIDPKYIPLGSMLYLNANLGYSEISKVVFAQDTGGAIKGSVRADLFVGSGEDALSIAGRLKAPLKLWIFLPKID